jgi:hypothetical protein
MHVRSLLCAGVQRNDSEPMEVEDDIQALNLGNDMGVVDKIVDVGYSDTGTKIYRVR